MFKRNDSTAAGAFSWWGKSVSIVLLGLLLLQYVIWLSKEKSLWWPETVVNVKWTLAVTAVICLLPRISWLFKGPLLAAALLAVNAMLSHARWLPLRFGSLTGFSHWTSAMFAQLQPFIWFSLSAAAVYVFANWWTCTKLRIYLLMIMTILFFAVRDSFSTLILWPQVAMVLFCGLLLLIVRHFIEFRSKAPKSWEYIAQYPSAVMLPIVLILAVTLVLGIFTPTLQPMITDPYTAWKHAKGEPVLFEGKGEISDWVAPTKNTASGYSRNDLELGGGFSFDYTPVFTVESPERSYWRGEARSYYTGAGWEESDSERNADVTSARVGSTLKQEAGIDTSLLKTKEVVQTFRFEGDNAAYPVLFAAESPDKLKDVNGGTPSLPLIWAPGQSELRFRGDKAAYPKEYTVVSQLPVIDVNALRSVSINANERQSMQDYLQLPDKLPQRVRALAQQITQNAANPYDKAKAIEQYLSQNYPYTNTPDLSKGRSKDFVDRFLFEIKDGYCDYFSTAMVVLTRSIGIPARWVKGYASGVSPMDEQMNEGIMRGYMPGASSEGPYTVRNADAHSWVEVYFPGYGWIPFEPTSGFTMPELHPQAAVDPAPAPAPTADPPAAVANNNKESPIIQIISIASAVLGLAGAALFAWKRGILNRLARRRKKRAVDFSHKIVLDFEKLLRSCRRKGYRRFEHETLREAFSRWMKQSRWLTKDLEVLLQLFEKAKYSKTTVTAEDYQLASQTMQKLRSQL